MPEMPSDSNGRPIPVMQAYGGTVISGTTTSARVALPTDATIVTIVSPVLAYVKLGTVAVDAAISADGFDASIPANGEITLVVPAGSTHIAAILPTGTGVVSVFGRR